MRSNTGFGRRVTNWELLDNNLQPHLEVMPHLRAFSTELRALIGVIKTIDAEQEIARGELRELTRRRQDAEKQGESLRRRVASHLKGTFGFTSEQLIQFGVNPRPTRTRPRKSRKPAETAGETPAAQPAK